MSDVKARAEERRKKILARQNKQVSAVGGEDENVAADSAAPSATAAAAAASDATAAEETTSPISKSANPLRQRREMIAAAAAKREVEKAAEEKAKEEAAAAAPVKAANDDPDVETIDEMSKIVKSTSTNSMAGETTPKKEIVYVKKTMKEIEEEVAVNTKKFDESALSKPKDEKKTVAVKPRVQVKSNVQPSSVMRLVRLLLIVLLGVTIGYRTVKTHKDAEVGVVKQLDLVDVPFDEFDTNAIPSEVYATPVDTKQRTWGGWAWGKLKGRAESTFTAVGGAWMVSRLFSGYVNQRFKVVPTKGENIMTTVLNMYQSGFEGIFEIAYSTLGELSLYLFVIVVAVTGFTVLYTDSIVSSAAVTESVVKAVVNEL